MQLNKAPTPCLENGCFEYAINRGRCQTHYKPWTGSNRSQRLPADWQTRRQIVFKRDNYVCYLCGSNEPASDTIDHVISGDDHSLNNLKPVHDKQAPHCHRFKTARDNQAAKRNNNIKYNK